MADPTFDELTTIPTHAVAFETEVLPEMQNARDGVALRVTNWTLGGAFRTLAHIIAEVYIRGREALAALTAGQFEDYAFGRTAAPNGLDVSAWAPVLARQRWSTEPIAATRTERTIRFTNALVGAYGPIAAGGIVIKFPSGNLYRNKSAVTIAGATTTDATFESEYAQDTAGGYSYSSDAAASTLTMVTASYPGVTVTNPATTFSTVSQTGVGSGTVTPSGTPVGSFVTSQWAVRIDTSGQVTVATWSYRYTYSGFASAWISAGAVAAVANASASGITITLANGTGTPSFVANEIYYFNTPGTDITQVGRDEESVEEMGERVAGYIPAFAYAKDSAGRWIPTSPTDGGYKTLLLEAFDEITQCLVVNDATINNKVRCVVAGSGATLAASTLTLAQSFLDSFNMLTDYPVVESPTVRVITFNAIQVSCTSSQVAAAKTAMQAAISAYMAGNDEDRDLPINGTIDRGWIVHLIESTAGVTDTNAAEALTLNGALTDLDLEIVYPGAYNLATWAQTVGTLFTFNPV